MSPRRSDRTRGHGADRLSFGFRSHWRSDGNPKNAYPTQREALAAAEERRTRAGAELSVYRCDFCAAWHLGGANGAER